MARFGKAAEDKDRAGWEKTPVGRASTAKQNGDAFFEIQLQVGESRPTAFSGYAGRVKTGGHADILGAIEDVGWRLEHVGYYYLVSGQDTHNTFLAAAKEKTSVRGQAMGVYLFRNTGSSR